MNKCARRYIPIISRSTSSERRERAEFIEDRPGRSQTKPRIHVHFVPYYVGVFERPEEVQEEVEEEEEEEAPSVHDYLDASTCDATSADHD